MVLLVLLVASSVLALSGCGEGRGDTGATKGGAPTGDPAGLRLLARIDRAYRSQPGVLVLSKFGNRRQVIRLRHGVVLGLDERYGEGR